MELKYMGTELKSLESVESLSPLKARAEWYTMWGHVNAGVLDNEWFENSHFGKYIMALADKVGVDYNTRTMEFVDEVGK